MTFKHRKIKPYRYMNILFHTMHRKNCEFINSSIKVTTTTSITNTTAKTATITTRKTAATTKTTAKYTACINHHKNTKLTAKY